MNLNKNILFLSAFLAASLCVAPAFGNGNTTADAPEPIAVKKAVRKATVKRPVKKNTAKNKKSTQRKTTAKAPAATSLERGIALMKQDRYELARPWLQKAVQENRRSAAAWYWYGMYHEKTGKFHEAQYFYTKAVQADPTFDPLSRVVNYPDDENKKAVWDPRRPARVYDIATAGKNGTIVPPNSPQSNKLPKRTDAANNPELPRVPVYTPPEPGAMPTDGDEWHPSVYVPPAHDTAAQNGGAVYVPPSANSYNNNMPVQPIEPANDLTTLELEPENNNSQPVYTPPLPVMPENNKNQAAYQPPAPDKKVLASSNNSAKKVVKSDKKQSSAKNKTAKKSASKTKKQAQPAKSAKSAKSENSGQTVKPETSQPRPRNNNARPESNARQQNNNQPQRPRITELPPVGQSVNNSNVETPLPPVGQR